MRTALQPALDNLGAALGRLESLLDTQLSSKRKPQKPVNDAASKKIAAKLDQTISRLEMLLDEE